AIELAAREEVGYENYSKAINIEARTMIDMVKKEIIPAVMEYTTTVAKSVAAVKAVGADASVQEKVLKEITTELSKMDVAVS
ncbi:MAG: glutamine synthetase type III, partial [Coprococcus catus]